MECDKLFVYFVIIFYNRLILCRFLLLRINRLVLTLLLLVSSCVYIDGLKALLEDYLQHECNS